MTTSTDDSPRSIFVSDKLTIIVSVSLLAFAAGAWMATHYFAPLMMTSASGSIRSLGVAAIVSSPNVASVSIFETTWVIGMVAMMFPAIIPIVLFYNKIAAEKSQTHKLRELLERPFSWAAT